MSQMARLSAENIPLNMVITSFEGLRAAEKGGDFVLGEVFDCLLYTSALKGTKFNDTPIFSGRYGLGSKAVSYTHLDVYKRQSIICVPLFLRTLQLV